MARAKKDERAGAAEAPAQAADGGDVKIDIEVEDGTQDAAGAEAPEAAAEDGGRADEAGAAAGEAASAGEDADANADTASEDAVAELSEEEMVAAAIAAGEAAADNDFKLKYEQAQAELAEARQKAEDELAAAKAEAQAAIERHARLQADWENYRRRTERERAVERERACEGIVSDLLPAIDDLERAIEHAGAAEGDDVAKQLVEGVSAVHAKVLAVLEKQGVELIDPAGEPFDPQNHQAVGRVERPEDFDETVADVYQKGYRLGGKVIRPAMVTVTFGGARRPAEPAPGQAAPDEAESGEQTE